METRITEATQAIRPNLLNWIGAICGFIAAWWTGLPALAQALLIAQGADIITGVLCAAMGKSEKSESGRISSGALVMGVAKKGLEWLAVLVCIHVGVALGMEGIGGAAMTYMMATELVSLAENFKLFGLDIPALNTILDVANKGSNSIE